MKSKGARLRQIRSGPIVSKIRNRYKTNRSKDLIGDGKMISVTIKGMVRKEHLKQLVDAYLVFLITREEAGLKPFLSTDFVRRLNVSRQLKFIKTLPSLLDYGLTPEAHLWDEYLAQEAGGGLRVSPLQFDVCYRNSMNPLQNETMTVTINAVILENGEWKIDSVLCEADYNMLVNYTNRQTVIQPRHDGGRISKIQPKP